MRRYRVEFLDPIEGGYGRREMKTTEGVGLLAGIAEGVPGVGGEFRRGAEPTKIVLCREAAREKKRRHDEKPVPRGVLPAHEDYRKQGMKKKGASQDTEDHKGPSPESWSTT
jgi:hypothetical protein